MVFLHLLDADISSPKSRFRSLDARPLRMDSISSLLTLEVALLGGPPAG